MATKKTTKKTAKKTTKKTAKKKTKKTTKRKTTRKKIANPKALLHYKISEIRQAVPEPPCTGVGIDPSYNEFRYTRAEEIISTYREQMNQFNLTLVPVGCRTFKDEFSYRVEMVFELTDIDTGYSERYSACGLGTNGVWSLNSAQTVALKQCLLMIFGASWPNDLEDYVQKHPFDIHDVFRNRTWQELKKELEAFFDERFKKAAERITTVMSAKGATNAGRRTGSKKSKS